MKAKMKAVVYTEYGSPDVLRIEEVAKPTPQDNEVLIKIQATTVTAVDSAFRRGQPLSARLYAGLFGPKQAVLGGEMAGVVEAVGKDVTRFRVSDPVYGHTDGGHDAHAEYVCVPEDGALAHKPTRMTFAEAAAAPGVLTALPFLRDSAAIERGQKILIIGASGSIGTFAVQLARYYGAEVTGVCSTTNVALVQSLGADHVIDYTEEDFTQTGVTYDIIFDTVGKSSFSRAKGSLKQGGVYLTTVLTLTIIPQMIWTSRFGGKKAVVSFTGLRSGADKATDLRFLNELVEAGEIQSVIGAQYPLAQIAEAHRNVDTGHKRGNAVIIVAQNDESAAGAVPDSVTAVAGGVTEPAQ